MSYQRQQFGKAFLVIVVVLLLVVTGALALSGELLPAFSISAALVLLLACLALLVPPRHSQAAGMEGGV